jgi:hypothetical protein
MGEYRSYGAGEEVVKPKVSGLERVMVGDEFVRLLRTQWAASERDETGEASER